MGGNFKFRNRTKAPIERLDRCHRRLEERLAELVESSAAISKGSSPKAHWDCVADVLAYLERAVVRHEEDEEASVFPRLAKHPALRPLLNRLRVDHQGQRKLVSSLAKILENSAAATAPQKLASISKQLQENYLDHIRREDRQLLPAIARYIGASEQAEMAAEMAARRG